MLRYAAQNFSTMTDLDDALVRESGIGFHEAQEVIARVVNAAGVQLESSAAGLSVSFWSFYC
ncbi:hypothetical protein [Bradyrhizobium cenepequi]|uniref:hypothetical protein n=1 Tax=Bradyrhizobium cenepequi TaxID=2821403 RepID=UPI001CE2E72F|nr:hypothetical protein [Bradyrhizobium cenepequi]MCA6107042.1 hypothetical protein [Bradyrhizobium cenepequi]